MKKRNRLFLAQILLLAFSGETARACTGFADFSSPAKLVGKSFDWSFGDGQLYVNKRNVKKSALALSPGARPEAWVSRYGNLTFNQYGREFPMGGINEAGLVVEVLQLAESTYPAPDARPALNELQVIQFLLDQFGTLEQARAGLQKVRVQPVGANVHYFVCDLNACGVLEYLDHSLQFSVHNEIPVITNSSYTESLDYARQFMGFGGRLPVPESDTSLDRFVRAASLSRLIPRQGDGVRDAFGVIDRVALTSNQWRIVYDRRQRTVHYALAADPANIKQVHLDKLDWSCRSAVKFSDLDNPSRGDLTGALADFSFAANQSMIGRSLAHWPELPAQLGALLAEYPASTHCTE